MYLAVTEKGKLFLGNHPGKDWFDAEGYNFGDNLVDTIAEGNGPKFIKGEGFFHLKKEG